MFLKREMGQSGVVSLLELRQEISLSHPASPMQFLVLAMFAPVLAP